MSAVYPDAPGFQDRDTSKAAAVAVAPRAKNLRERVLASVRAQPCSPEALAERLGLPLLSLRPRFSELSRKGLIEDSGARDASQGGKRSIVWRVVA